MRSPSGKVPACVDDRSWRVSCWVDPAYGRRALCAISRHNRHGLCGNIEQWRRTSATSPPSSRWRAPAAFAMRARAGRRQRLEPQRGGAPAGGEARRAPAQPHHAQRRADRGRRAPARAARRRRSARSRRRSTWSTASATGRPARCGSTCRSARRGWCCRRSCRPSSRPIPTSGWRSSSRTASSTCWRPAAMPASATTSGWSRT